MRDFRVGDRVRVVNEAESLRCRGRSYDGERGTVVDVDEDNDVSVEMADEDVWWFGAEELELEAISDPINHPDHYQSESGIECIDAIRAALTPEEFRGYCKGAALKYIWRERKKGGDESLGKGVWYLNEAQK